MSNNTRAPRAFDFGRVAATVFTGVTHEKIEERVEDFVSRIPVNRLGNARDLVSAVPLIFAQIPGPLRAAAMLGLAEALDKDDRVHPLVKLTVPSFLRGAEQGLSDLFASDDFDQAEMRRRLLALFDTDAKVVATKTVGECVTGMREGSLLHRRDKCGSSKTDNQVTGTIEEMAVTHQHKQWCQICYPELRTGRVITVEPKKEEPKKATTIADVLIANTTGPDAGRIGRSLHAFEALCRARRMEELEEPRAMWRLNLAHQKGLENHPTAVALLPTFTEAQVNELLDALNTNRGIRDLRRTERANPPADEQIRLEASNRVIQARLRDFGPYIAQIKLAAQPDIFDGFEWLMDAIDFVDDRITDVQRQWLLSMIQTGNLPLVVVSLAMLALGLLLGVRFLAFAASWAVRLPMALTLIMAFFVSAFVYLPAAWNIVWNTPGSAGLLPEIQQVFFAWGMVFTSTLVWGLVDTVPRAVGDAIRGVIPDGAGPIARFFGTIAAFARERGWLPAAAQTAPIAPAEGESQWWRQTGYTISFVTSLITVILCMATMASEPWLIKPVMTIMLITTVTWIAIWLLRYVSPMTPNEWKVWALTIYDMPSRKADWNKAKNWFIWTLMAVAVLFVVTTGVSIVTTVTVAAVYYTVDGDNVAFAHEALKSAIGQALGNPKYSETSAPASPVASNTTGKPSWCESLPELEDCK